MKLLVGIDIGTHSSKGVLAEAGGHILARAERPHGVEMPRHGWAEQDAEGVWWEDFRALSRELLGTAAVDPQEVAGVGVSAIAPCVVPVDAEGRPLRRGILYGIDTRAVGEIAELTRALGSDWIEEVAGSPLSAQSAGPKILWLAHHEAGRWRAAAKFLTSTGYVVRRLTGRSVIDNYTAAFYAPLFNIWTRRWEARAVEAICSPEQLPATGWTTEIAGAITGEAARETGLAAGTPVIFGTADAAAEAVSAGATDAGDAMLMYGSSLFIIALGDLIAKGGPFWPAPFLFPGTHALAAGMATSGAITEWFRTNFTGLPAGAQGPTSAEEPSAVFASLAREAAAVAPGSEGLLVLPYFSGERTPINDPLARGVVAGLSLRHSRAHLYRAILEGVAYGIRHNLEEMAALGVRPRRLYCAGGGTKNREWLQIVSDVTGREQIVRETMGACVGDALLAGIGCGALGGREAAVSWLAEGEVIAPRPASSRLYDRYYVLFRELYLRSAETLHALAGLAPAGIAEEA